ncbi:hypothetical protein SDC9_134046 [bioreactor metagenome]|uniref:Uncharacterized protein n=1 Tax=bioreactor metagenome TaxID=1076179 RepID=A0A645DDP4_9ZZZZ
MPPRRGQRVGFAVKHRIALLNPPIVPAGDDLPPVNQRAADGQAALFQPAQRLFVSRFQKSVHSRPSRCRNRSSIFNQSRFRGGMFDLSPGSAGKNRPDAAA